jgi:hypothetical protein
MIMPMAGKVFVRTVILSAKFTALWYTSKFSNMKLIKIPNLIFTYDSSSNKANAP